MEQRFKSTMWSVVLTAQAKGTAEADEALAKLCSIYWLPLYTYVRRRGYSLQDAEDMTQEFFARFLEKEFLQHVERGKGRFRSLLLVSMNHFLADDYKKTIAAKRGGGAKHLSLDFENAEYLHAKVAQKGLDAETLFDLQWANTLIGHTLNKLRDEYRRSGKSKQFEALESIITHQTEGTKYAEIGKRLGMSEAAVKMAVLRLRKKFRQQILDEIRETLADPADAEQELSHLLSSRG